MTLDPDPAIAGRLAALAGAVLVSMMLLGAARSLADDRTPAEGSGASRRGAGEPRSAEPILLAGGSSPAAADDAVEEGRVRALALQAKDGHNFQAEETSPPRPGAPGILLVPDLGRRGRSLRPVLLRLRDMGYHVLAMDNTGQTRSVKSGPGGAPTFTQMDTRILDPLLLDVEAAGTALRQGSPPGAFAVVGYGIGGNLAIMYADATPAVNAVALILPGHDCSGFDPSTAVALLGGRSALLLESEKGKSTDLSRLFKTVERVGTDPSKERLALPRLPNVVPGELPFGLEELLDWVSRRLPVPRS